MTEATRVRTTMVRWAIKSPGGCYLSAIDVTATGFFPSWHLRYGALKFERQEDAFKVLRLWDKRDCVLKVVRIKTTRTEVR